MLLLHIYGELLDSPIDRLQCITYCNVSVNAITQIIGTKTGRSGGRNCTGGKDSH